MLPLIWDFYRRQIGVGEELLGPFEAINPGLAIALGLALISVFPGLWGIHTLRVMNSKLDMATGNTRPIPQSHKVLFVVSMTVTVWIGFQRFSLLQTALTAMAVGITLSLPLVVTALTIKQIMTGGL